MNENDELKHYGVIGMKWGQHRARRNAEKAEKYKKLSKQSASEGNKTASKQQAAKAMKYSKRSKEITSKHQALGGKKTFDRVKNQSTGKTIAQSMLMGSYGALKYNQARAQDVNRGMSAVSGFLYAIGNGLSYRSLSIIEPRFSDNSKA